MGMNFYAESVALLWTTAMRFGAPDPGRRGFRQCFAIRRGTQQRIAVGRSVGDADLWDSAQAVRQFHE
jgi:hypothetical protein